MSPEEPYLAYMGCGGVQAFWLLRYFDAEGAPAFWLSSLRPTLDFADPVRGTTLYGGPGEIFFAELDVEETFRREHVHGQSAVPQSRAES